MATSGSGVSLSSHGVDWEALRAAAFAAMLRAYVPYSHFPVGAAGLVADGRMVSGCNVENASFGLTLCAECSLISQLCLTGGGMLTHVACVDRSGNDLMPCGRCRQLLYEHGGPSCLIHTTQGILPLSLILPNAFGPHDLSGH